jgi:hypothetical protein
MGRTQRTQRKNINNRIFREVNMKITRREFLKSKGLGIFALFLFGLYSPDKNEENDDMFTPSDKEADFYEELAG